MLVVRAAIPHFTSECAAICGIYSQCLNVHILCWGRAYSKSKIYFQHHLRGGWHVFLNRKWQAGKCWPFMCT
jgi:hypothetical protein